MSPEVPKKGSLNPRWFLRPPRPPLPLPQARLLCGPSGDQAPAPSAPPPVFQQAGCCRGLEDLGGE